MLLLLNLLLVLLTSLCVAACLRLRSRTSHLLALFIIAYADVVLVLQLAGLLQRLDRSAVLSLQAMFTIGAALAWIASGRPALMGQLLPFRLGRPRWDWRLALKVVALLVLGGAVAYAYFLRAGLILVTHPDNYDALTYHLSRVGYWLQYHSFYPWPTPNARQTTFPMNAELGVLWTVLWWGSDRLSGFVQWITVPVTVLGIYGLARLLGHSRWSSAMAALLWATLPQTLYQSATTQNDLVTSAFWVVALYFLFVGVRARKPIALCLSGLSLGLAIGTKSTSLIALIGMAVGLLAVLWEQRWSRQAWRSVLTWLAACAAGFLLLGSYTYVQNLVAFGNPLGASSPRTGPGVLQTERGLWTFAARLRDNVARYTYQLVDFSPLPDPLPLGLNPAKAAVLGGVYDLLGVELENKETTAISRFGLDFMNGFDENTSWFGPLAIAFMLAVAVQALQGVRQRDALRLTLVLIAILFLVVHSALQRWTPYKGRYYLLPIAVGFPLVSMFLLTRTAWRTALAAVVVALGLAVMFTVTQKEGMLSGVGWRKAFSAERRPPSWASVYNFALLERIVPEDATLGLEGGIDYTDYIFFGEHFKRYVTLSVPEEKGLLPRTDIDRFLRDFQNSQYLYLRSGGPAANRQLAASEFALLSDDGVNSLWIRSDLRAPDECDGARWPFTDFISSSAAPVCPQFPISPGIAEGGDANLIHLRDGLFVPKIGPGARGTVAFGLLVKEETRVMLKIEVAPAERSLDHTVQLLLSGSTAPSQFFERTFSRRETLEFQLSLVPDTYRLEMRLAPGANEVRILGIELATP